MVQILECSVKTQRRQDRHELETRTKSDVRCMARDIFEAGDISPEVFVQSVVEHTNIGVYADDVNMLGENPQTIRKNTGVLLEASKAIGLEVNPEKTKYMIMSRDQNIVRNGTIKVGDLYFEGVEKFKYLGATVTNINDTREEIKHRTNMGNACYYSVEKILSSSLLSKNVKVIIYKTVILPVVLYGCKTWTLTLREEHRLRVFENKVLRKIFGVKRDEVTGEWRKLHNAELHALYSSPDIIRNIKSRRLRWAGHVARMGESRNAYRVLVGRPEGKRPLGRPRHGWEDNIKMDLREVGYDDRDWINLAQDRDRWRAYVRAAMNLRNVKSRRFRWAGHVARMGEPRNAYRVLVGRPPERKRPLRKPRHRWEDNIKMVLRAMGYDDREWINLAQDRDRWRAYVRATMNLRRNGLAEAVLYLGLLDLLISPLLFFFVWEQMRNLVYATPIESEDDLVARIFAATREINYNPEVFNRFRQSMFCRLILVYKSYVRDSGKWIGRGGSVSWPPRSPDLTPLIFAWGQMPNLVYATPIESEDDLVPRIFAAAGEINENPAVFNRFRQSMSRRCNLCVQVNGGKEPVRSKICINNMIIEQVKNFSYLGHQISYEEEKDLNEKIIKFNRAMGIINQIFKPTLVQKHTRTRIYKTLARPILYFGSEAWTIRNIDSQRLTAAEMRFMRRTAGYTRMDHIKNFGIMKELQIERLRNTYRNIDKTRDHMSSECLVLEFHAKF
ncbi:hypothetical protein ANN_00654 [Periplaneta americana]|uniref:Reverse transcriptase domain-containing protein n=1 Tax=Periplaneta americana TaxID=6978 RepID=A0ABQ8TT71_PERAM|nr:hypothetical protein ANN_00654 [Periplaneta americana]